MIRVTKQMILIAVLILVLGFLVYRIGQCKLIEAYSTNYKSASIHQAKQNGVFVKKVKVYPEQFTIDGKVVKFKECWIEEQCVR